MASAKHIVRRAKAARLESGSRSPSLAPRASATSAEARRFKAIAKRSATDSAYSQLGAYAGHAAISAGVMAAKWAWPRIAKAAVPAAKAGLRFFTRAPV